MANLILLKQVFESHIEIWTPIAGCRGYEISNLGNVRSFWRLRQRALSDIPRLVKSGPDKRGYRQVRLTANGQKRSKRIHRLVAEAFLDNPENKPQVNHRTGIKSDNRVWNLEWTTNQENTSHAVSLDLYPCGENSGMGKWPNAIVEEMRILRAAGMKLRELESRFGASRASVHWLIYGRKKAA